jgi:hypothetical protein
MHDGKPPPPSCGSNEGSLGGQPPSPGCGELRHRERDLRFQAAARSTMGAQPPPPGRHEIRRGGRPPPSGRRESVVGKATFVVGPRRSPLERGNRGRRRWCCREGYSGGGDNDWRRRRRRKGGGVAAGTVAGSSDREGDTDKVGGGAREVGRSRGKILGLRMKGVVYIPEVIWTPSRLLAGWTDFVPEAGPLSYHPLSGCASGRPNGLRWQPRQKVVWPSRHEALSIVPRVGLGSCFFGSCLVPLIVLGPSGNLSACSLGLSATSQQYFSLTTNQPPATSQQYFSLRTNQHQPSASNQTNRLYSGGGHQKRWPWGR